MLPGAVTDATGSRLKSRVVPGTVPMTVPDVLLLSFVGLAALRGLWRGFFREAFGLLALLGGLAAAVWLTPPVEVFIERSVRLPPPIPAGAAFVGIFVTVHTALNGLGAVAEWIRGGSARAWLHAFSGACLGAAKGAVILAFLLLFLHLFPVLPKLDARLGQSIVAQRLMAAAARAVRTGWTAGVAPNAGEGA